MEQVLVSQHFTCDVYVINVPKFLADIKTIIDEELSTVEVQDVMQTHNMDNSELDPLASYIAQTVWNLLNNQGYDMDHFTTHISEFWVQQFNKNGMQTEHVHNHGAQMSGFYFLEVPENSCKACFHDPNRGKLQIALPEKDESKISYASTTACYDVNPGDLIIFNSWLPHSFTPNKSDQPFKFIHFNTVVDHIHTPPPPATHVI